MANDGKVNFGLFSPQVGKSLDEWCQYTEQVERLDFHSVWFMDHMWALGRPEAELARV